MGGTFGSLKVSPNTSEWRKRSHHYPILPPTKVSRFFKWTKDQYSFWFEIITGVWLAPPCPSLCLRLAILRRFLHSIRYVRSQKLNPCQSWKSDSCCCCASLAMFPCGRFPNTHAHKVGDKLFLPDLLTPGGNLSITPGLVTGIKGTALHYSQYSFSPFPKCFF